MTKHKERFNWGLGLGVLAGFCLMIGGAAYHWWVSVLGVAQIAATNILYCRLNKECFKEQEKAYQAWRRKMQKTHDYLGITPYYETELWRNRATGEEEEY